MLVKDVVLPAGVRLPLGEVRGHHDAAHRGDQAARREHHQQEPAPTSPLVTQCTAGMFLRKC